MESCPTHGPQQQEAALMTRTDKYVALDVHQATTLASVRAETGRVIARTILPTEAPALGEFFRGIRGPVIGPPCSRSWRISERLQLVGSFPRPSASARTASEGAEEGKQEPAIRFAESAE